MGKRTHRWTPPRTDRPAERKLPPFIRTLATCRWHDCHADHAGQYLCRYHLDIVLRGVAQAEEDRARVAAEQHAAIVEKIDDGVRLTSTERPPGHIYYARIDGLIKIGYAKSVQARMRQYPPTAQLLAVEPGTLALERKRHQHFGKHLAKGREWFHGAPDLTEWIDTLVAEYGAPDRHTHTWGRAEKPQPVASKRIRNRRY